MKGCLATLLAGLVSAALAGALRADDNTAAPAAPAPKAAPAAPAPAPAAAPAMSVTPAAAPAPAPAVAPAAAPAAAAPAVAPAGKSELVTVEDLAVGTGVQDHALQGAGASFSAAAAPKVFCFSKVETKAAPTKIVQTWFLDGKKLGDVELKVGGSPWRTWSNHAVVPGAWKVEVTDADGKSAGSVEFTVTQ